MTDNITTVIVTKVLAKARYINDDQMGALLSVKKIHKIQAKRDRVTLALDSALDAKIKNEAAVSRGKRFAIFVRLTSKVEWFDVEL